MSWGQHPCAPLCPLPALDGLRKRRKPSPSALLPASFAQDQSLGQNQVPWPTWADGLSLTSPPPLWASGGEEPAPACTSPMYPCPINMFPTGQGSLLLPRPAPHPRGSPCGPRSNSCCMEKCPSRPSPCSICTEQGRADLSQTHSGCGMAFFPPLTKNCFSSLKCFGVFFPLTPHPSLPTQGKLCERLHTRLCNWRAADHPEMRATTSSLHHLRESAPGPVDSSTPPSAQTRRKARHQKRKSPSTLLPCGMMRTPVSPHGDFPPLSFIDTGASYNGNSITVALVGPWSLPAPPESPGGVNGPPLLCQGSCPASPCSVLSAEDPQTPCTLRTGRGGGRPFAISLSPVGRCLVPPAPRWWAAHHSWQHRGMLAKVPLEETIFKHTFRLV